MPKTNFTKTEKAIEKGLQKMAVERLLEEADKATPFTPQEEPYTEVVEELEDFFKLLKKEIKKIYKRDQSIYKHLGIKKEELDRYLDHPQLLKPVDIEKVKEIQQKVEEFKRMVRSEEEPVEQDIIEKERKKHLHKRHNVKDTWLPL